MSEKLTEARREALANVATGEVHQHWPIGPGRPRWLLGNTWQPLRAQPYEWLRNEGLIRDDPMNLGHHDTPVRITTAGQEALAAQ